MRYMARIEPSRVNRESSVNCFNKGKERRETGVFVLSVVGYEKKKRETFNSDSMSRG